jgi:hypothetical protein
VIEAGLADLLRQKLGIELRELAGTILAGELPLRADVVNRLVARQLAQRPGPIETVHLSPRDGQRIDVALTLNKPKFMPPVKADVRIETQPSFPDSPVLGLRWSLPHIGPLAAFVAPILASFRSLPPGITLDGDRALVNIAEVMRSRGLGDLIRYVGSLKVTTREGAFVVEFALRIPG